MVSVLRIICSWRAVSGRSKCLHIFDAVTVILASRSVYPLSFSIVCFRLFILPVIRNNRNLDSRQRNRQVMIERWEVAHNTGTLGTRDQLSSVFGTIPGIFYCVMLVWCFSWISPYSFHCKNRETFKSGEHKPQNKNCTILTMHVWNLLRCFFARSGLAQVSKQCRHSLRYFCWQIHAYHNVQDILFDQIALKIWVLSDSKQTKAFDSSKRCAHCAVTVTVHSVAIIIIVVKMKLSIWN